MYTFVAEVAIKLINYYSKIQQNLETNTNKNPPLLLQI